MVLALGILAMTVGLIRSESSGELRTLTATGATGSTRRTITATTAAGLAGLGAILGIAGAYLALAAGRLSNLTPLPVRDLLVIVLGTPLIAAACGWLLLDASCPCWRRPIAWCPRFAPPILPSRPLAEWNSYRPVRERQCINLS